MEVITIKIVRNVKMLSMTLEKLSIIFLNIFIIVISDNTFDTI